MSVGHILAVLVISTNQETYTRVTSDVNDTSLCSTDRPTVVYAIDELDLPPTSSACLPPSALCSWKCTREQKNCTSFNWKETTRMCELYSYTPAMCAVVRGCSHFQVRFTFLEPVLIQPVPKGLSNLLTNWMITMFIIIKRIDYENDNSDADINIQCNTIIMKFV